MRRIVLGALFSTSVCGFGFAADFSPVPDPATAPWLFEVEASALWMKRSQPANIAIMSSPGNAESGDLLSSGDFDERWSSGFEGRIGVVSPHRFGAEVGLMWLGNSESSVNFVVPGGVSTVETTPATVFVGPADATGSYKSGLRSIEANATYSATPGVTLLAGIRHLSLDERFGADFALGGFNEMLSIDTENRLWGLQGGVRLSLSDFIGAPDSPLYVGAHARGGVFRNTVTNDFLVERSAAPPSFGTGRQRSTAWLAQAGLDIGYRLTSNLTLHGGYQALWLNGVALAPNQVPAMESFNVVGERAVGVNRENILYHGVKVGLTARW